MGQVNACDGARAQIAACATSLVGTRTDFWSIGKLISINPSAPPASSAWSAT